MSRISVDTDRYRRGLPEMRKEGTIVKRAGSYCWVQWDEGDPTPEQLAEADVRYWVDTGKARITAPVKTTLITEMLRGETK